MPWKRLAMVGLLWRLILPPHKNFVVWGVGPGFGEPGVGDDLDKHNKHKHASHLGAAEEDEQRTSGVVAAVGVWTGRKIRVLFCRFSSDFAFEDGDEDGCGGPRRRIGGSSPMCRERRW